MCGGTLEINANQTTAVCEYCGTNQTISKSRDEVVQNLFNRANNLRLKAEFDKAQEIYEKIVTLDTTDSEAYWGSVLCKYGIEYVEDPKTLKRVHTCHRTQMESVLSDVDFRSAMENATVTQKTIYEEEAKKIDRIQKETIKIVTNEKPYDIFICYKETDESGKRTSDSVMANDIYYQLTQENLKVFYAPITLEDKLGSEYEPYIFAALNSSKVMLVVGSKPEYFNAVWVKNEWSRYLKLLKNDRSKLLIPCYKDMDAYDLPEEFSHLQAQDMSKIGFINDIVRGIKKLFAASTLSASSAKEKVVEKVTEKVVVNNSTNPNVDALLKRISIFLEDEDWKRADEYCEKVLDIDPENAEAYLYKYCVKREYQCIEKIGEARCFHGLKCDSNFKKADKYAQGDVRKK